MGAPVKSIDDVFCGLSPRGPALLCMVGSWVKACVSYLSGSLTFVVG